MRQNNQKREDLESESEPESHLRESIDDYISKEDFTSKKRLGMPFEGLYPDQMTEERLKIVNDRWESFYRRKKKVLERFTGYDQDLVSIGMLSARRMLCLYPGCSDELVLKHVKYDIMGSLKWGTSLDSRKHHKEREDITPTGQKYLPFSSADDTLMEDVVQYQAVSHNGYLGKFERLLFDRLQYQEFWDNLNDTEKTLVKLMKEEKGDKPRWYHNEYVRVAERKGKARKRFMQETGVSDRKYRQTYVSVRLKFYEHFGAEVEIQREKEWFENFKPEKSIHPYKTGKYAKKK